MCTSTTAPDLFFDHSSTYFSIDIDPGTAGALEAGTSYTTSVRVRNDGISANAAVRLYVCPPGTNVTAGTAILLHEGNVTSAIPACTGAGPGVSPFAQWTYTWDPGAVFTPSPGASAVHMCLFAQVKYPGGILGVPATNYPGNSNPTTPQNAQHNIDVIDVAVPFKRQEQDPDGEGEQFFGFAIPNPLPGTLKGRIVVEAVTDARKRAALVAGSPRLKELFGRAKLRAPARAGVVLGKERLFVPNTLAYERPNKRRAKSDLRREALRVARFGHTGELTRDTFRQLADGEADQARAVTLSPNEVRQGMLHIVPPRNAKPGDLFVFDIRHEVANAGRDKKKPTVIGGLIVVVRAVKARRRA